MSPIEELTKTWLAKKGILIKSRPKPSRFTFAVCLAMVLSIAFGFLGGFITAGFALGENYNSVMENLLADLENMRHCMEREKEKLLNEGNKNHIAIPAVNRSTSLEIMQTKKQDSNQAIFTTFTRAIDLLQKNDKARACAELESIVKLRHYRGIWRDRALRLINKDCRR